MPLTDPALIALMSKKPNMCRSLFIKKLAAHIDSRITFSTSCPSKRPKAVYSNRSPFGIASGHEL